MKAEEYRDLGFAYRKTAKRFVSHYRAGAWDEGSLTDTDTVTLSESACVLQYAQTCFEGLKAYRTPDGRVVLFRPDLNAERMAASAERMVMPPFPTDRFVEACRAVVRANIDDVPPAGSGATLYLRPVMFGTNATLGVKPATEFEFRVFASPVGPYFKGGERPLILRVPDLDRAAPHGTGSIKAGLNYAMSLYAITEAHALGYDENLYLDPATRTYIEETGGANVLLVSKTGKIVTPISDSILPSITRRSLVTVAAHELGLEVEERKVALTELSDFVECGLCGTAAVISPVGRIDSGAGTFTFPSHAVIDRLRGTLTDIQTGKRSAPEGWIVSVF